MMWTSKRFCNSISRFLARKRAFQAIHYWYGLVCVRWSGWGETKRELNALYADYILQSREQVMQNTNTLEYLLWFQSTLKLSHLLLIDVAYIAGCLSTAHAAFAFLFCSIWITMVWSHFSITGFRLLSGLYWFQPRASYARHTIITRAPERLRLSYPLLSQFI